MTRTAHPRSPGMARILGVLGVAAVLLLLSSPGFAGAAATPLGATSHASPPLGHSRAGSPSALPAVVPATQRSYGPLGSGPGSFFSTTAIPGVPIGAMTCPFGTCVNVTNNPSLNLTTSGALAVAYVAYTNQSPCPAARPYAYTEVGFSVSTNLGTTWSVPKYLGNPDCSAPALGNYPSAWEPSLTSLSNGTLVLVYVEYNLSSSYAPFAQFGPNGWNVPHDRLVLTESHDNGSTWSTPKVLNSSDNVALNGKAAAPERPWAAATGSTVYVTWMNWSTDLGTATNPTTGVTGPTGSAHVHLVVSTDGGATFGAVHDLRSVRGVGTDFSMNPSVLVGGGGTVYVAYASNFTLHATYGCLSGGCLSGVWTNDVLVASSTDNGTLFNYSTPASAIPTEVYRWGSFHDPSPQMAYASSTSQLFVTFSSSVVLPLCTGLVCSPVEVAAAVYLANSSTAGTTWSALHEVAPGLLSAAVPLDNLYNPAVAIGPGGRLQMLMTYTNGSVCGPSNVGNVCNVQYELSFDSLDNGSSFSAPLVLSDFATEGPYAPDGEYATAVSAGSRLWLAWTVDACPGWAANFYSCYYPGLGSVAQVQVSQPYSGVGRSLTFTETGLPAGQYWWANVMGNLRGAAAPASLVVTGIPPTENISWSLSLSFSAGYGRQYSATSPSLLPPTVLAANTTVAVPFSSVVLLNFDTVPLLPNAAPGGGYCFGGTSFAWGSNTCTLVNYNVTPLPGPMWVVPGAVVYLNVTPVGVFCAPTVLCYSTDYLNLTFVAFSGTGAGSVNSSATAVRLVVNGPVNETASFQTNGWCTWSFPASGATGGACFPVNTPIAFHERGLPAGQSWSVTTTVGNRSVTNTSNTAWNPVVGRAYGGLVSYAVWTIPSATPGQLWVANSSPASPVVLPYDPVVNVNFSLQSTSTVTVPLTFSAVGLPAGTSWSYLVNGSAFGVGTGTPAPALVAAGAHELGAQSVYLANGTRYTPTAVDVLPYVIGQSWTNGSGSEVNVTVIGPALVEVVFSLAYSVTADATPGGSVSPGSAWVRAGSGVALNATANVGFSFLGWNGTGLGAVRSAAPRINVLPYGAVRELATFAPVRPQTWSATISASGLPASAPYTVDLGNRSFTGAGTFVVPGIASGSYALGVPRVQGNSSNLTEFASVGSTSSFPTVNGNLSIVANGTIALTFSVAYLVALSASAGGTVSFVQSSGPAPFPGPGTSEFFVAGSILAVSATPSSGFQFVGYSGSGTPAANATTRSIQFSVTGPVDVRAEFEPTPSQGPPPVSPGTLNESGLPSGTVWSLDGPSGGTSGASTSLPTPGGIPVVRSGPWLFVPIVYVGSGTRYVPDNGGSVPASAFNLAGFSTINFTEQFLLTVVFAPGGVVTPSTEWANAGTQIALNAVANASWSFGGWSGTGSVGAFSGSTSQGSVTLSGPTTETATFAPIATNGPAPASSTSGQVNALLLLVGLLVVGVAVGLLWGRMRSRPPSVAPEEESSPDVEGSAPSPEMADQQEPSSDFQGEPPPSG